MVFRRGEETATGNYHCQTMAQMRFLVVSGDCVNSVCGVGTEPSRRCIFRRGEDGEHWRVSLRLADGSGAGEADDARKGWKDGRGD